MRNLGFLVVFLMFSVLMKSQLSAVTVLSEDFSGGVTSPPWSTTSIATTPSGERFWGGNILFGFNNGTQNLSLSGLPIHSWVNLSFNLYIINTWDGGIPSPAAGPDRWTVVELIEAGTLLDTTFSNNFNPGFPQNYPFSFGGPLVPYQTGAVSTGTLGYSFDDAIYHISLLFPHTGSALSFDFSASGLQGISDESWGIDNVIVMTSVPEPSTYLILGSALVCFGLMSRKLGKRSYDM
jgi:PEP-CTERM motif